MPITIEGRNLVATHEGGETLYVQALQVWVATPAAQFAHDIVKKLSTKGSNNMNIIPGTLRRDNQDMYYKTIKKHVKWLKNIGIYNCFGSQREILRNE